MTLTHRSCADPTAGLAAIHYAKRFHIDGLLAEICRVLKAEGVGLGGLLQICDIPEGDVAACRTAVHAVDLRTGDRFDIWDKQDNAGFNCRLNEGGLDHAASAIDAAIDARVDLLIINRFGRAESQGRGLCPSFASAIAAGVPVLTCVRPPYDEAWSNFHDGAAEKLSADADEILAWASGVTGKTTADVAS